VLSLRSFKRIRTAAWLLAAFLVVPSATALAGVRARPTADAEREQHAELGRRYVDAGRFHDAISEYRKAYELKADPEFLFAIAGCYRQLGNSERALFFYQRYLTVAPPGAGTHFAEAQQAIAALGPSTLTLPPAAPEKPLLPPSLTNDVVIVPLPASAAPLAAPPDGHPLWRRWWVWTLVGVVVLGGAAAALAVRGDDDRAQPTTALGNMRY
jgi:tetratricopeptide (TPR) repeat protein